MNTPENHFDVIVIGSGPGGEGAAITLAKSGKTVAIVERYSMVGGGCTHWGTIPSKTFIHMVRQYSDAMSSRLLKRRQTQARISAEELMTAVTDVVEQQAHDREGFYQRNGITVIEGFARFIDPQSIEVREPTATSQRFTADHFVIATGTHPYRPDDVDFDNPRVVDSDTILLMEKLPATLTVYGAGVVGCEYASAFRALGVKVDLVNTRKRILEFLDDEISNALSYHMSNVQGLLIRQDEEYRQVEVNDEGVTLHLKTGKTIKSDMLLWSNGRTGSSSGMGLEALGIETDQRGNIPVNDSYQTVQPHIYAVGDIVGYPNLASAAYDQGRFVGCHIADTGEYCIASPAKDIPTGIYTDPEVSCVGETERTLTEQCVPYEVGRAFFRNLARGQISDHRVGMLKLLFHRDSLELLGIHCFGHNSAELLHLGQTIMAQPKPYNTLKYFIDTTFNYPTMAEAYRVAALNGYNRL